MLTEGLQTLFSENHEDRRVIVAVDDEAGIMAAYSLLLPKKLKGFAVEVFADGAQAAEFLGDDELRKRVAFARQAIDARIATIGA